MYEPPWKPGSWTTFLNSEPNSSSQMSGWTTVIATNHGCRHRMKAAGGA